MMIQKKFNKRSADLIEVQPPSMRTGKFHSALGIRAEFFGLPGSDEGTISMHMTPDEALDLAARLIQAARQVQF